MTSGNSFTLSASVLFSSRSTTVDLCGSRAKDQEDLQFLKKLLKMKIEVIR